LRVRTNAFFVSTRGDRLKHASVQIPFQRLVRELGLLRLSPHHGPRPHDLRHTFVVRTLLDWYRFGVDVQRRLHLLSAYLGHTDPAATYWYLSAAPELMAIVAERLEPGRRGAVVSSLAPTLQAFFIDRLGQQRAASPHTVAAYRATFRMLLSFCHEQIGTPPSRLCIDDLGPELIAAFLDHMESARGNSVRTRNARLAAIHSFFRYAALQHPEHAALIQRVLAIPHKRHERALVAFLEPAELEAILAAPNQETWIGRRDHALLVLAAQTGLRQSELTGLRCQDVHLGPGPYVRCHGKRRKERLTPLTRRTVRVLRAWLLERGGQPTDFLFPSRQGGCLSPDAFGRLLHICAASAARRQPSLVGKVVTPHVLRHTCAMELLRRGVDTSVIALWLGHETVQTTQIYLHADMSLKERALSLTAQPNTKVVRYKAPDALLAFLSGG